MMRAAAGFDGDERWRELLEVSDHLRPPELATDDHGLGLINTMELEHRFGSIHADADR